MNRSYEPPLTRAGTTLIPGQEWEIYPGVRGYAMEHEGLIYIPMVFGQGDGQVGKFLDELSPRCRMVNVISAKLRHMLKRRGWKMKIEQEIEVDVWEPPMEKQGLTDARNSQGTLS